MFDRIRKALMSKFDLRETLRKCKKVKLSNRAIDLRQLTKGFQNDLQIDEAVVAMLIRLADFLLPVQKPRLFP
jgi:hypothetical protein